MTEVAARSLDWGTILLFSTMTVITVMGVPLFAYFHDYTALDWILLVVLYIMTGMGITVGYHRMIAHRSFECRPSVKICLLILGGWALQNSALRWCADHIRHHAKTDSDEDPYNATRGFWHSHCGWLFIETPHRVEKYESRLRNDPLIMWQHRHYVPIMLSGLLVPFIAGWINGGWASGLGCFLLAGMLRTLLVLNSTFTINSLCHLWGTQPHGTQDSSRDNWLISFVSFGEGYHNYHHTFSRDYRNGPEWYHFDPSKWLIYALSCLGLTYNLQRHKT